MNRKVFVLVMALLAGVMLLVGNSVLAQPALAPADVFVDDLEPNNIPAQAQAVAFGNWIRGSINSDDAVDYYRFEGQASDVVAVSRVSAWSEHHVTLLDSSLNPIPMQGYSSWAVLPVSGTFYISIAYNDEYEYESYTYEFVKLEGNEPNETLETAIPVAAVESVVGTWDYLCDKDFYRFEGRAGDVFPDHFPNYRDGDNPEYLLFDADGRVMDDVNVLPADGTYYLLMQGWSYDDGDGACLNGTYTMTVGYPLWVSGAQDGLTPHGATAIKSSDIAMRANEPGQWQLVFDGSDVGITQNIDAIERWGEGSILMSLGAVQNVPGLGKVKPQDIIRFIPTSLGETTAGTFEWYLDGSDVGLTTSAENIDAIVFKLDDWSSNVELLISMIGKGVVPRERGGDLQVADEDLINFASRGTGLNSAGKWRMNLDGSSIPGMAAEDISAATFVELPSPDSPLLLSFNSAFNIGGIAGGPKDVLGLRTGMVQGMVVKGFTNVAIDALTVGAAVTP